MPYELRSTDGRVVIPIDDSEAYQLADMLDARHVMAEVYGSDRDEDVEERKIYEILDKLFDKFRDANIGEYFRNEEAAQDFPKLNPFI